MRKIAILILIFASLLIAFNSVLAAGPDTAGQAGQTPGGSQTLVNPLGNLKTFDQVVNNVIKVALGLTGVFALLAFIYGGITWMLSMGDPSKVTKGKNMMIWAVAGLLVIFASYAILVTVFQALGVGGGGSSSGTSKISPELQEQIQSKL